MPFIQSARPLPSSRQEGVAIITALLITALAVTIVSSLFWQQQVQVRSIENQRLQLQKEWVLRGALDWAGAILRGDANRSSNVDYLGQPWSIPLAETRLNNYLDENQTSGSSEDNEAGEVTLSGQIIDAQSRYNLTNLGSGGLVNPVELATFGRLLTTLHLPPDLASAVATAVANSVAAVQSSKPQVTPAVNTGNSTDIISAPLIYIDDLLAVPGISPEMIRSLRNFVVVLPIVTPVNLNTASAEVLAACFDGLTSADAASLISSRTIAYFRDAADFSTRLPGNKNISATSNAEPVAFSTNFFLVNGNVRMGRATSNTLSLIKRVSNHSAVLWTKEE
ncbi:type II secretion system minor pseudopilin GspK [Glaciimonas sp. PAMC28666]|uniref:type II secretion system minor pseudopilin GspK n=1 Tax=Glaciimonas sp. PAMC28666 TaxID=2807626 RepID=UPI001964005D|nr:type II secretion system minor pseudopilin GspK [Glaciimonas sp. PAMC28666]QRX82385.1 type II secretion system minor pseudopilin GspK [Glaciimonas sp. PAMC28666]